MANICSGTMNIIIPTKNAKNFLNLMKYENDKDEYICACLDDILENIENVKSFTFLSLAFSCRWSVFSSLIDDSEDSYSKQDEYSMTLLEALKKYDVQKLNIYAEEPGIGFSETVVWEKDDNYFEYNEHEYLDRDAKRWEYYEEIINMVKGKSKKQDEEMEM